MSLGLSTGFVLASFLVVISPGPATVYVANRSIGTIDQPIKAVAGIVLGDVILIALSGMGVAALVTRFPEVASGMKLAGAAYVAWIGLGMVRAAASSAPGLTASRSSFSGGLLLTLSNPKAILFFAAFFPLFMAERAPVGAQLVRLGLLFETVNLAFYAVFIAAMRFIWSKATFQHGQPIRTICGIGLMLAAVVIGFGL
jgi:leucine efflux protein